MVSLDLSGINLRFDEEKKKLILIDQNVEKEYEPNLRKLKDMNELFFDSAISQDPDTILYYMFRNVFKKENEKAIAENKLRYDVTIIPPNTIGGEYIKTAGHYHPVAKDGLSFPEIYEVLSGEGLFMLQKESNFAGNKKIKAVFVLGKEGDLIFIPPNYGHITINVSKDTLCMANWVSSAFESVYGNIKEKKGGAFYILKRDPIGFKLEKNSNYDEFSKQSVFATPKKADFFGFPDKPPMYEFLKSPEKLSFLHDPTVCPDLDYD